MKSRSVFCLALVFGGLPKGLPTISMAVAAWSITFCICLRAVLSLFFQVFSYVCQFVGICWENSCL